MVGTPRQYPVNGSSGFQAEVMLPPKQMEQVQEPTERRRPVFA